MSESAPTGPAVSVVSGSSVSPGKPRLRVAPSPTGDPHVGTAYMALFNLAFTRQQGGAFLLRVEDTDRARYQADSEQQLYDTLTWLGLHWDEGPDKGGPFGPYRQSERLATYAPFIQQLLDDGHAYHCWCSPERLRELRAEQEKAKLSRTGYDRRCYGLTREQRAALPGFQEKPVVRLLVPDDVALEFDDLIRGRVSAPFPDDQVILKADGFPTYHLAVVVDDHLMGITHVVRGEEWISSTPKHLLLYRFLGWTPTAFAHMPLLRNTDKSKISKRKNPAARLTWFQEQGYLPEALLNFLALLGYPPAVDAEGHDLEVFTFTEFSAGFAWSKVNPVGPIFDLQKLDWLNGTYIRALPLDELARRLVPFVAEAGVFPLGPDGQPSAADLARLQAFTALIRERMVKLTEAAEQLRPFFTLDSALPMDDDALATLTDDAPRVLDAGMAALAALDEPAWTAEGIQAALRSAVMDGLGIKPKFAFGPLRVALSGRRVSPPLFESMDILGRESTLARLRTLRESLPAG